MHHETFLHMKKQLGHMDKWLETAAAHAVTMKFEPNLYLGFRLAPDQFALVKQVQAVCDTAKLAASRLTGKDAPAHPDTEQTVDELRARIRSVIAYLDGFSADDFAESATRSVTTARWEGKTMTGANYFLEHGQPNFYFHLGHVYAILRHNGVSIGKRDYLGALTFDAPKT